MPIPMLPFRGWRRPWLTKQVFAQQIGTGEVTRAPLYVTAPWNGWRTPDVFPNIAALLFVAAAYVPHAPIEPTFSKAWAQQLDQPRNIAVGLQTQGPAGKYLDPTQYLKVPAAPDIYPNIAVRFQTQTPAGSYIDPVQYKRAHAAPDLYPNRAVNLQTVTTWPTVEPIFWKQRAVQLDQLPDLAVAQPVLTAAIAAPIEPQLSRQRWVQPDLYQNIAVRVAPLAPAIPLALIEPTYAWKWVGAPELFPNIAVGFTATVPVVVPPVVEQPAGKKTIHIYRITVDGKVFHFGTMTAALAFLDKAKTLAQAAAQAQTRQATNLKGPVVRPEVPRLRTTSPDLRGPLKEANAIIKDTFDAAWRDAEIAAWMAIAQKHEKEADEDILWWLM